MTSGARVLAFVPDLLFGSNVVGALATAGLAVTLSSSPAPADALQADVLVVDLTADVAERIAIVGALRRPGLRTLAFYAHVETEVKAQAEAAGFDLVIPRSRMAREGAALVARLAAG